MARTDRDWHYRVLGFFLCSCRRQLNAAGHCGTVQERLRADRRQIKRRYDSPESVETAKAISRMSAGTRALSPRARRGLPYRGRKIRDARR